MKAFLNDLGSLIAIGTLILGLIGICIGFTKYKKTFMTLASILVAIISIAYLYSKLSNEHVEEKRISTVIDTPKVDKEDTSKNQKNKTVQKSKSSYKDLGDNLYEIIYEENVLGYIQLPKNGVQYTAYIQHPTLKGDGSGDFLCNLEDKDYLLSNLGEYIIQTREENKRLILGIGDGGTNWSIGGKVKYGKDKAKLKYPKVTYEWHPVDRKGYNVQGWLDFDND